MNLKTRFSRKQSTPNLPKKKHFLTLIRTRTCAYQGVRNVRFLENMACFAFLKQQFWDSIFYLITDEFFFLSKLSNSFCLFTFISIGHVLYKLLFINFKVFLTQFSLVFYFYTPWKCQKAFGFLIFSGGID